MSTGSSGWPTSPTSGFDQRFIPRVQDLGINYMPLFQLVSSFA
jgi:hypothetical protein